MKKIDSICESQNCTIVNNQLSSYLSEFKFNSRLEIKRLETSKPQRTVLHLHANSL